MKRNTVQDGAGGRRRFPLWGMLGFCLVMCLLLLWQPARAFGGESYSVFFENGRYWYVDPNIPTDPDPTDPTDPSNPTNPPNYVQVYPVTLQPSDGWQMKSVTVGEDSFWDGYNNYMPEWAPAAVMTLESTDGIRVLTEMPTGVSAVSYSIEGNVTTLMCQVPGTGSAVEVGDIYSMFIPEAPDERSVVRGGEIAWYYAPADLGGAIFRPMPRLRLFGLPEDCRIISEDVYGGDYGDAIFSGYFLPGQVKGSLDNDDYRIGLDSGEMQGIYIFIEADRKTFTIDASAASSGEELVLGNLDIRQAVNLTFPASEIYYLEDENFIASTTFTVPSGKSFYFYLQTGEKYRAISEEAFPSCTITNAGGTVTLPLHLNREMTFNGVIPGDLLMEDASIIFNVDESYLIRRYSIIPVSGTGYRLEPAEGGSDEEQMTLYAELMVDAGYSNSQPQLSAEGCSFETGEPYTNEETGEVMYFYFITREDGNPFEDDLAVMVSGIVRNGGGGGGGGSYDPPVQTPVVQPPPAVRVENKLDQAKVSSDTILWPLNTVEEGGVSTTVITDQELAALLELARHHAEDTENLEGDGLKEGIILIEDLGETSDNRSYVLRLTDEQFQSLAAEGWDRLTLQTPAGSFSLYDAAIGEASGGTGGDRAGGVHFEISRLEHQGRPGVDATLTVDSSQVTVFELPYGVRLFIPYTPAAGEDVQALAVEYIHADGTAELVTECSYDAELGGLFLFTTHLSKFGVVYRPAVFEDVGPSHWANPYVTFLAARGVVGGYQGGVYLPDQPATRAEFISLATKALSAVKLPARPVQVYSDVPASNFMAGASNWLYYNNLAGTISDGSRLLPNEVITREDMAALLSNIASGVGLRIRSKGLDAGYTDTDQIASYARQAVLRLRAAGILEMAQNYKFNPKAPLNRGEMAQITAMLLNNL